MWTGAVGNENPSPHSQRPSRLLKKSDNLATNERKESWHRSWRINLALDPDRANHPFAARSQKSFFSSLQEAWGAVPAEKLNHDIARYVRLAHLTALEQSLDGYASVNAKAWDSGQAIRPLAFQTPAATFCREQRSLAKTNPASLDFQVTETLTATIDGLLAQSPQGSASGGNASALAAFARETVLNELATLGVTVPPEFATHLRHGAPRFLTIFADEIREAKNTNQHFRDILLLGGSAELKAPGFL
jgi:hypothetical protein